MSTSGVRSLLALSTHLRCRYKALVGHSWVPRQAFVPFLPGGGWYGRRRSGWPDRRRSGGGGLGCAGRSEGRGLNTEQRQRRWGQRQRSGRPAASTAAAQRARDYGVLNAPGQRPAVQMSGLPNRPAALPFHCLAQCPQAGQLPFSRLCHKRTYLANRCGPVKGSPLCLPPTLHGALRRCPPELVLTDYLHWGGLRCNADSNNRRQSATARHTRDLEAFRSGGRQPVFPLASAGAFACTRV